MNIFSGRLSRKKAPSPLPPWEEIVRVMYDKGLDAFQDKILKVIYSRDKTKRFVLLRRRRDCYTFVFEILTPYDEDEWVYISRQPDALPAAWETPFGYSNGGVLFSTFEQAEKMLYRSSEYDDGFDKPATENGKHVSDGADGPQG